MLLGCGPNKLDFGLCSTGFSTGLSFSVFLSLIRSLILSLARSAPVAPLSLIRSFRSTRESSTTFSVSTISLFSPTSTDLSSFNSKSLENFFKPSIVSCFDMESFLLPEDSLAKSSTGEFLGELSTGLFRIILAKDAFELLVAWF